MLGPASVGDGDLPQVSILATGSGDGQDPNLKMISYYSIALMKVVVI